MTGWSLDDHKWTGAHERRGSRDLRLMDVRKVLDAVFGGPSVARPKYVLFISAIS
jgi:hypothetical protein